LTDMETVDQAWQKLQEINLSSREAYKNLYAIIEHFDDCALYDILFLLLSSEDFKYKEALISVIGDHLDSLPRAFTRILRNLSFQKQDLGLAVGASVVLRCINFV
jgi:cytidylate kinase